MLGRSQNWKKTIPLLKIVKFCDVNQGKEREIKKHEPNSCFFPYSTVLFRCISQFFNRFFIKEIMRAATFALHINAAVVFGENFVNFVFW